jgi:dTMP kinase
MTGKFIVLESIECAGKGTATDYMKEHFTLANAKVKYTREIGGTPFAERIREMMLSLDPEYDLPPASDLMIAYGARIQHTKSMIVPALESGYHVFSERYYASTLAYQSQYTPETQAVHDLMMPYLRKPNITLLLDITTETMMKRMYGIRKASGIALDKFEVKSQDFFEGVRNAYHKQIDDSWVIIDAERSIPEVKEQLCAVLNKFLGIP